MDHYGLDAKWESRMRRYATALLAIDDFPHRIHDCDFLLDPTVGHIPQSYADLVPAGCRMFTGTGFALVDPEYAYWRTQAIARRRARRGAVGRVLIGFGGIDQANATAKAIKALELCGFEGELDVVLGAVAPHQDAVRDLLRQAFPQARLHIGPSSQAPLMALADLAIGAAGTTSWERCTVGLPAVVLSVAPNQRDVAQALADSGAALYLGEDEHVPAETLARAVTELLADRDRLTLMAELAAALCDGLGAARVALELLPERAKDGGRVTLRLASPSDREQFYAWQADPSTRRYARNPNPPTYDEHCRWFEGKLRDPACIMHVIEHDGAPAGVVRLDTVEGPAAFEISIFVDPARKQRGIGGAALKAVRRLMPWATFHAWVHPDNTASQRLFEGAGFSFVDDHYISRPSSS